MATDLFRYDLLVQDALRSVMRRVLSETAREGLPGNHHFVISFLTHAPGVRLSQALRDEFPQELTIVLQHQFWDLVVTDRAFEVGLSFHGKPEVLFVPFEAVTRFFDPAVEFGLKFETATETATSTEAPLPAAPPAAPAPANLRSLAPEKAKPPGSGSEPAEVSPTKPQQAAKAPAEEAAAEDANVVSIDAFRKKT